MARLLTKEELDSSMVECESCDAYGEFIEAHEEDGSNPDCRYKDPECLACIKYGQYSSRRHINHKD